tara:strand:- start:136585 stop:137307 length:723 start_codon:yes stop_codon:yes gene_type:complete
MKTQNIILATALTLCFAASPSFAAFEDKYDLQKKDQVVFDTDAGRQLSIRSISPDYAVCAMSVNDGYGAVLFLVDKQNATQWDIAYEDIDDDDSDYENTYKLGCLSYAKDKVIKSSDLEKWRESMTDKAKQLGGEVKSGSRSGERIGQGDVYLDDAMELTVDDQAVADIYHLRNPSENFYVCALNTDNTTTTAKVLVLPHAAQTFHVIAKSNGNSDVAVVCKQIRIGLNYTFAEVDELFK